MWAGIFHFLWWEKPHISRLPIEAKSHINKANSTDNSHLAKLATKTSDLEMITALKDQLAKMEPSKRTRPMCEGCQTSKKNGDALDWRMFPSRAVRRLLLKAPVQLWYTMHVILACVSEYLNLCPNHPLTVTKTMLVNSDFTYKALRNKQNFL